MTNRVEITSENGERSDTVISRATDSNAREWNFTYFGPSTYTITNTVNDDADIDGEVVLKSATYKKDGSINKKGGKFVSSDPAVNENKVIVPDNPKSIGKNRRSNSSAGSSYKGSKKNFYRMENGTYYYLSEISDGSLGEWIKK